MNVNTIWVHCSATKAKVDIGAAEIRKWHTDKGWSDIGYHFVIRRNGQVEKGRPETKQGAHVYGYNKDSIGICMVGGLDDMKKADANFTFAQYSALVNLIADLQKKYGMDVKVRGHRDVAAKSCPCFSILSLIKIIRLWHHFFLALTLRRYTHLQLFSSIC